MARPTTPPPPPVQQLPYLLSEEQVRDLIGGVSERWLRARVQRGEIPALRVGARLRFRGADIAAWLDRQPARDKHGNAVGVRGTPFTKKPKPQSEPDHGNQ